MYWVWERQRARGERCVRTGLGGTWCPAGQESDGQGDGRRLAAALSWVLA